MEEAIKSIKAYLYDRSVSPLFGSLIISWCVWNYKIILTVFSGENLESKFKIIENLYDISSKNIFFITVPGKLFDCVFMPLTISLFYIFVYPYLAKPVYKFSLRIRMELLDTKQKMESQRLLTVAESRKLYRQISELEVQHENDVIGYRKQIAALVEEMERNKSLDWTGEEGGGNVGNGDSKTDSNDGKLLDLMESKTLAEFSGLKDGYGVTSESVAESLTLHIDKVRYYLEQLVRKGYVFRNGSTGDDNEQLYMLRPEGTAYLVEHELLLDYDDLSEARKREVDKHSSKPGTIGGAEE
jgi:hypothetical protein